MDSIFHLALGFTSFVVVVSTIYVIFTSKKASKLPPGRTGWPIIGETLDYIRCTYEFVHDRMAKYSPNIFQTSIIGERVAVICGPSGNKFLFSNESKLCPWMPNTYANILSLKNEYSTSLTWKFFDEHLKKFLKLELMQHHVPIMDLNARDHLETQWVPYQEVKVQQLTKDFTFVLACHLLMNYHQADSLRELALPFYTLLEGFVSLPLNFPGTTFHRAMKAAEILREKLEEIIRRRRKELELGNQVPMDGQDLLTRLLVASKEDGVSIDEKIIAGKIKGVLMASFHNTSNSIAFALGHLAEYPDVYAKVLQEQLEIVETKGEGEPLTWKDIQKMKYTWNVVCESMRLTQPNLGSFREVITDDFSYAGFTVPQGDKIHWTVCTTHKDPAIFPDPEKFDPSRFEKRLPPCAYVPFGAGPHMCWGKEYARIETLVFLHNVVIRFRLRKVDPNEKIVFTPIPVSVNGLQMCLLPHEK